MNMVEIHMCNIDDVEVSISFYIIVSEHEHINSWTTTTTKIASISSHT